MTKAKRQAAVEAVRERLIAEEIQRHRTSGTLERFGLRWTPIEKWVKSKTAYSTGRLHVALLLLAERANERKADPQLGNHTVGTLHEKMADIGLIALDKGSFKKVILAPLKKLDVLVFRKGKKITLNETLLQLVK
ncbi:hypothetical protein HZC09_06915 [Candidatus Micrarchaeota archaeon]|nr:hypothetical protein [Candidatus Micrarchaeota archaeon]